MGEWLRAAWERAVATVPGALARGVLAGGLMFTLFLVKGQPPRGAEHRPLWWTGLLIWAAFTALWVAVHAVAAFFGYTLRYDRRP